MAAFNIVILQLLLRWLSAATRQGHAGLQAGRELYANRAKGQEAETICGHSHHCWQGCGKGLAYIGHFHFLCPISDLRHREYQLREGVGKEQH